MLLMAMATPQHSALPLICWLCFILLSQAQLGAASTATHSSNWAVLVSTSRYWLNYRHSANIMSIYRAVRKMGLPDSNILLMLADDHACNPRNPFPAALFSNESHKLNVYGDNVEVDYRGYEVTVENFLRLLAGRHDPAVPRSKRLLSDSGSNILIYLTGHGGDEFLKFQDVTELMAQDLADGLATMAEQRRYHQVLLMVESCEAATMLSRITAPRVIAMASSIKGEKSMSYSNDFQLGQPVTDHFTHVTLSFMESLREGSEASLQELMGAYRTKIHDSTFAYRLLPGISRPLSSIRVTEFFGAVSRPVVLQQAYTLPPYHNISSASGSAPQQQVDEPGSSQPGSMQAAAQEPGKEQTQVPGGDGDDLQAGSVEGAAAAGRTEAVAKGTCATSDQSSNLQHAPLLQRKPLLQDGVLAASVAVLAAAALLASAPWRSKPPQEQWQQQ